MTSTRDIVSKLWNLCHVLRDDGVTYHQYVTELTFLLFLKMARETGQENELPKGYRWGDLVKCDNAEILDAYRALLLHLGKNGSKRVRTIFTNASTSLRQPVSLGKLVTDIDALDWFSARDEGLGEMYEGLLAKNAEEVKSGAGQYFTPRPLIECIVDRVKPQVGETVLDPAAGTGGFLVAASQYIHERTDGLYLGDVDKENFQIHRAFHGVELVPDVQRLALMNALLHGFEAEIRVADALGTQEGDRDKVDVILTNPPFGTKKGGGAPVRAFTHRTSNKQLLFLQHIYNGLVPGGRAAVVLPDNVLFEDGVGQKVRQDLMNKCDLHTILRLPTGIFYAQGVKTNVLFFTRGASDKGHTKAVWFYDMRTNAPSFGKRTPLTREHFSPFDKAYGEDPHGKAKRKDQGEEGKFRKFTREDIAKRGDNLDITWLRDESVASHEDLPEPEVIAAEIVAQLEVALEEMRALQEELGA